MAGFFRAAREFFLGRVGQEGRDFAAARRHRAEDETERRAAQPRLPGSFPILLRHPGRPLHGLDGFRTLGVDRDIDDLADGEEAHGDDDDIDTVEKLRHAHGEARLPGLQIDADEPQCHAEEQTGEATHRRLAEYRGHRHERQHHQREIIGRAEQ